MKTETYTLQWNGTALVSTPADKFEISLDQEGRPDAPWQTHSCLGDDQKVWCEVFRAPQEAGGIFLLRDFDEVLFVAQAQDNLSFVQALNHFAQSVSNARYAMDIFANADEDFLDDEA